MKEVRAYFDNPLAEVAALEASPEGFVEKDDHFVFYREDPTALLEALEGTKAFIKIEIEEFTDSGWATNYLKYQEPVELVPGLWTGKDIILESTNGFGLGTHPTTKLCASEIYKVTPSSILDIGCGSGILSILAAKLGATKVHGIDIDADAVNASNINARANKVQASFETKELSQIKGSYDMLVANILSETLISLWPFISKLGSKHIILSGVLKEEQDSFLRKLSLRNYEVKELDGWILIRC